MIIRQTVKLGQKIKVPPRHWLPADPNPLADWSAHVFTLRRFQYILLTNTTLLYSTIIPGRGVSNESLFLRSFSRALAEFMQEDGFGDVYERQLAPTMDRVFFAKSLNRRITGAMTELVFMAKAHLEVEDQPLYAVSFYLNEMPMKGLGYQTPRAAMEKLVQQG